MNSNHLDCGNIPNFNGPNHFVTADWPAEILRKHFLMFALENEMSLMKMEQIEFSICQRNGKLITELET